MLNRLRPMALGHVPLRDILPNWCSDRARQHPEIAFTFNAERLERSYGDLIDLTVYRCVQESLTNVIRHAQAKQVDIELGEGRARNAARRGLRAAQSDRRAMTAAASHPARRMGFGILGMQERVQGAGRQLYDRRGGGRGTRVDIVIPLRQ